MSTSRDPAPGGRATSALAGLQSAFQSYLLQDNPDIEHWIAGTGAAFRTERLGIYRHSYFARLANALRVDFKALAACMGERGFAEMAELYARTCPSTAPSIRWYGRCVAEFLHGTAPYRDRPHLAELAAFEWALTLAFDAPDAPLLTSGGMAALPPDAWAGARVRFHPSLQRLDLNSDVPACWRSVVKEGATEASPPAERRASWVVWRHQMTPHYRSLEDDEAWAMDALLREETFGTVCEGLTRWHQGMEVPLRFASLLKGWIAAGMVARILD